MKKQLLTLLALASVLNAKAQFGEYASAVDVQTGTTTQFYDTKTSANGAQNISGVTTAGGRPFQGTNFGSFTHSSGSLVLQGAETKTYKGSSGNVCGSTLYYTVYPSGSRPASPTFTALNLSFYDNCSGGTFPTGGPCNSGDQKWASMSAAIDLTAYAASTTAYVLEVYYQIPGSQTTTSACSDNVYDSNNGNNYTATFTITGTTLPVTLVAFNATQQAFGAALGWQTTPADNTAFFDIQRAGADGAFVTIGGVTAGNEKSTTSYSFRDAAPLSGVNDYRLAMTNKNGSVTFSATTRLVWNGAARTVSLHPNPAADYLDITGVQPGNLLRIFSADGRLLYSGTADNNAPHITLNGFADGLYLLSVYGNAGVASYPFSVHQ